MSDGLRLLVMYHHFGPYHVARWRHLRAAAAAAGIEALGLQVFDAPGLYDWESPATLEGVRALGLRTDSSERMRWADAPRLARALRAAHPDVVAVNGWGTRDARIAHGWCRVQRVPRVLVADTVDPGGDARPWREFVKRRVVQGVRAALVGGSPQRRYVAKLGVDAANVRLGCDVVDNAHFAAALPLRGQPQRRLLTVARLSPEKNLLAAAEAFLQFTAGRPAQESWSWSIAGYGPQEQALRDVAARSGGRIRMVGPVAYAALPAVLAQADLYWQPSLRDTWALSVNEAMAAGLAVLVSSACGCSEDLVTTETGWTFDPAVPGALLRGLEAAARDWPRWPSLGGQASRHIAAWDLERFSRGMIEVARIAAGSGLGA